jgi:hypothetical protein
MFWGTKLILLLRGYMGSTSLKTSCPRGLPLWGKEYGLWETKCEEWNLATEARLYVKRPPLYKLLKYKTYGDYLHSTNSPTSVLEDLHGDKPLDLSFRWWCTTHPILTQACRSSLCKDSTEELSYRRQNLFTWPSDPSNFLFCPSTSAG